VVSFSPTGLHTRTVGPPPSAADFEPRGFDTVVERGSAWRYLAGADPPEDWTEPGFDDSGWRLGPAGFGYGDGDDATLLADMRRSYQRVYVRRTVAAAELEGHAELGLMVRYDDAFIAYAGGREVWREGVEHGRGPSATGLAGHEAGARYLYVPLPGWRELLQGGQLVLALEGHNQRTVSSDFTLDPYLVADPVNGAEVGAGEARELDRHSLRPRPGK
jgi:hypothetical protein